MDGISFLLVAFLEDKFRGAGNVFVMHDVCYYFFRAYNFGVLYKHYIACT